MTPRFTRLAARDLIEIADYVTLRSPSAATRVREDIEAAIAILEMFPQAGRPQNALGVRKLITPRFAYLVYYRPDDASGTAIILTITHPARRRPHRDR